MKHHRHHHHHHARCAYAPAPVPPTEEARLLARLKELIRDIEFSRSSDPNTLHIYHQRLMAWERDFAVARKTHPQLEVYRYLPENLHAYFNLRFALAPLLA